jgi:tRNA dimethylallyltransferase
MAASILLMGPTGSGKTALAIALAERLPVEIVSVDSAMVYRGLDIGTAKPDRATLARAPHHLIDLCDPAESYSAGAFVRDAERAMADIRGRGRIPLLVGGTMLYFRVLAAGLAALPARDPELRRELDERAARTGWPALHAELARADPAAAARIAPTDAQRIQRALEVHAITGQPISLGYRADWRRDPGRDSLRLVVAPQDRAWLHERLARRLEAMMERGFLAEVQGLYARGDLTAAHPALRAVGYRQLWAHVAGEGSLEQACARAVSATRQLAKRQMTWLRREPDAFWFDAAAAAIAEDMLDRVRTWAEGRI